MEYQLLASSLADSTIAPSSPAHRIPSHPFPLKPTLLYPTRKDAVLVQVVAMDEVAYPALEMLEVLNNKREAIKRGEAPKKEGVEVDEKEEEDLVGRTTWRRGTTRLRLSDGRGEVDAVEWKRVQGLGLEDLKLGCKVSWCGTAFRVFCSCSALSGSTEVRQSTELTSLHRFHRFDSFSSTTFDSFAACSFSNRPQSSSRGTRSRRWKPRRRKISRPSGETSWGESCCSLRPPSGLSLACKAQPRGQQLLS